MSEWRPIETAPKDRIIVAARVQYGVANPLATVAWNGFAWVYSSCGVPAEQGTSFTHWMPVDDPANKE
jgi:hypothetical protein